MTKKINLLLATIAISFAVFVYLSVHHYSLKTGLGGSSLCSISSKVNCDAAASSNFSEIFNVPVAVLGATFQFVLFCFVLGYKLRWIEASVYLRNTLRFLFGFSALVSIVMALISVTLVKVVCPFCIATYVFSFTSLYLGWSIIESTKDSFVITNYFGQYKSHLISLALIPFLSWIVAGMTLKHYGLDQITKYVPEKIAIWKASKEYSFDPSIGLSNKVENPKFTLVEFADYKCPHCKAAGKTIELFLSTRNDVKFTFKPFPLDGTCNPNIQRKGDNSRCVFAAYTLCSEKLFQKGWEMNHWLFENQEKFFDVSDAKSILPQIADKFGFDTKTLESCADSAEIYDSIVKSTQEGVLANVEGTPTVYLNGKKLPWGQVLEVLKAAIQ
jgi:protein-disulfide isomerase/uncharacterized membrane protein